MIEITDDHLTTNDTKFGGMFLLLQAELDVAVFSGSDSVVVTSGPQLVVFTGDPMQASLLDPIVLPGFEGVVNDLHLSRLFASWTTEHGGALRLRAMFDEEGVELRGGLFDLDFDHVQLDVFMLPSLDSIDTVVWDTRLGFKIDGGVLTDGLRGLIEAKLLDGDVVTEILGALGPIQSELNRLLGLADSAFHSIVIEEGKASFNNVLSALPRCSVVFDAVEVHDNGDRVGQGELLFSATVAGIDVNSTEPVSAAGGTVVPLEGSSWRISPTFEDGRSVSMRFEAFEADGDNLKSLGFVDVDLDPDDAPLVLQLPASTGDFTLLARLEPRGDFVPPLGARHLRVSVPNVKILRDLDSVGKGEVRFWAMAAGQPTSVSDETKVKGGDDPDGVGLSLAVDLYLPAGEDLELRVVGWDVDPSQRDWLGEAAIVIRSDAIDDNGEIVQRSDSGDFEATILIVDLDAPVDTDDPDDPDDPDDTDPPDPTVETVRRLVIFESVIVQRDGDDVGPGDLRITATVNTDTVPENDVVLTNVIPIEASAGALLPLVGAQWRTELDVPVAGRLSVSARVVDVDITLDDPMTPQSEAHESEVPLGGVAALTFDSPGDFQGLGEHFMTDASGDVAFRLRILDPDARDGAVQAMVRFEEVEILNDHTAAGRGQLWCVGSVNGFPAGNDVQFKAGSGDSIVLEEIDDEPVAWTAGVGVDRSELLELSFEVFEARDADHVSLGTVTVLDPPPWAGGLREATSDKGDFVLRYRVWDPTAGGPKRLSVTFLEVTVLDDGEPTSEGELRFLGAADELWTELSVLQKARTGETVPLVGESWTLEPRLDAEDELTVAFTVYAEDSDALARLDRVEQRFTPADAWGLGEHVVTSPDEKFRVRYAIAPAEDDGLPDLPGVVPLLVEFTAVEVHDDGDAGTRGEVSFAGRVNGVTVLQTEQLAVDSGETVPLGAPFAPRTIWLQPDDDLEIELTASEQDGRSADVLGTSRRAHAAADGWDLGVHEVRSPGGAITATWRVDRADGPRARVKFLHVHVFDDDEPVKRGDFMCEGAVNAVTTGPSLKVKAGRDGASSADDYKSDIFLGGPRWTKTLAYDPDDPDPQLDIRFTLTELDGLSADDALGTVSFEVPADAFDNEFHTAIFNEVADSGKFELTFIAQAIPQPTGPARSRPGLTKIERLQPDAVAIAADESRER